MNLKVLEVRLTETQAGTGKNQSCTLDVNLITVREVLDATRPGDVVVLPEGMLSGSGEDLAPLAALPPDAIRDAVDQVAQLARQHQVQIFCGSPLPVPDGWCNAGISFPADGDQQVYRKINGPCSMFSATCCAAGVQQGQAARMRWARASAAANPGAQHRLDVQQRRRVGHEWPSRRAARPPRDARSRLTPGVPAGVLNREGPAASRRRPQRTKPDLRNISPQAGVR